MLKHDQFEEICAAAAIGEASPEELAELERHAMECAACRESYSAYLGLVARQFAAAAEQSELSPEEARECLNSEGLTRRFFERAQREGIAFSRDAAGGRHKILSLPLSFRRHWVSRVPGFSAAAAVVALIVLSALYTTHRGKVPILRAVLGRSEQQQRLLPVAMSDVNQQLADLRSLNLQLASQVQQLTTELRNDNQEAIRAGAELKSATRDRERVTSDRDALLSELKNAQQKLAASEAAVASAEQQLAQANTQTYDLQASLVADRLRIQELTGQLSEKSAALDRERQLLVLGHDVNALMGARNLHIVDVVDTDARGKTRHAFGRIFFTEGKSLIFYAYDLNEAKIEKANYQYRIWAKKEGQDPRVQKLGIFYSDDKSQRRWVFKCNDPKILNEIDSVFVTLEPANSDAARPKGSNLMYAYLRGQPNHP